MTASDILDGAFSILKAAPATIVACTAVFAVPVQVLAAWLQRDVLGGSSFIELLEESDSSLSTIESSGGDGQEVWATSSEERSVGKECVRTWRSRWST